MIVVESAYGGFLAGSNLYIYLNIVKIISIITRFLLTYICLYWCASAVLLIIIELITATIRLLMYIYILKMKTDICWERGCHNILMMKSLLSYTSIMFLDTIITIINNNSDNAIIGAICGAKEVAIYSFGIQIFSMFGMLSTSISMVMLPVMTKLVVNHVETHKLENCIIRAGKIQYILLGGMEFGFFILGKEFIMLWLGEDYLDVWIITFILMISSTIPLVENVTISILRAKNMMGIRVFLQFVEAVINIILTFALVKKFGYIVAAYTTAISSVAITTIILNIYYQIKLGLNMFRVLKSILFRTTITLIVGTILSYCIINSFLYDLTLTWFSFFIKGLIFLAIYSCGLLFFGISREERKYYLHQFRRK